MGITSKWQRGREEKMQAKNSATDYETFSAKFAALKSRIENDVPEVLGRFKNLEADEDLDAVVSLNQVVAQAREAVLDNWTVCAVFEGLHLGDKNQAALHALDEEYQQTSARNGLTKLEFQKQELQEALADERAWLQESMDHFNQNYSQQFGYVVDEEKLRQKVESGDTLGALTFSWEKIRDYGAEIKVLERRIEEASDDFSKMSRSQRIEHCEAVYKKDRKRLQVIGALFEIDDGEYIRSMTAVITENSAAVSRAVDSLHGEISLFEKESAERRALERFDDFDGVASEILSSVRGLEQ